MNQTQAAHTVESVSSMKMLRAMVGIGILCALMIVLTYEGTLPRVERLRAEALEQAIFKVLPGAATQKTFVLDNAQGFTEVAEADKEAEVVYAGYDEAGELMGLAIPANGMGFADVLRILYGYDPNEQTVVGFYVLESKETPGLGDKIEKDDAFLANFEALDVSLTEDGSAVQNMVIPVKFGEKKNPWEVDGITGATISSRAIGNIIGSSTERMLPLIYQQLDTFTTPKTEQ